MNRTIWLAVGAMFVMGCSTPSPGSIMNRAINKTVDSAANKVGERVGEAIAADILANNPHLINAYAMGVFNVMFYQGGYYLESSNYEVGEYSTWKSSGVQEADWFQKALLAEHANGNQWWRVETHSKDGDEESVVIMEALFSAPEAGGSREVLRMRALLPDDEEPREIPVTEEDSRAWYFQNTRKLTDESIEGMTVGEEEVTVPAGTYTTQHLRTKAYDDTAHNWWLNEAVPGNMVKFTRTKPDSEELYYTVELLSFGSDATTSKLGVDLADKGDADSAEGGDDDGASEGSSEDAE